jgi:hypothetical protein
MEPERLMAYILVPSPQHRHSLIGRESARDQVFDTPQQAKNWLRVNDPDGLLAYQRLPVGCQHWTVNHDAGGNGADTTGSL